MILIIDNYDSFTFNLYQLVAELGETCLVARNDKITLEQIEEAGPKGIILSPGPGYPRDAGITLAAIERFALSTPIFGVCLGHQAIGEYFGGRVVKAKSLKHGKLSRVFHDGRGVFSGLKEPFMATRYHSLVVDRFSLPSCLEISSETEDGLIMGLRHRELPIEGVQFHPESIATEGGRSIVQSFLSSLETRGN